jgi:Plasma-membrane choline transporter
MYGRYADELTSSEKSSSNTEFQMNSQFWIQLACMVGLGLCIAAVALSLIRSHAPQIVLTALIASVAFSALFFLAAVFTGNGGAMFIGGIFLLISVWYAYAVRNRINFAARILEICVQVVNLWPAMLTVAFVSIFVQLAWITIWLMAAAGMLKSTHNADEKTRNSHGVVYFLLLLSLFWTAQVVKNVVHVTVAGVMGSWYFLHPNNMPKNPTAESLKRASTTSFGTICLGSLLVAIVQAIRTVVESSRDSENTFVRCFVECILYCLESLLRYFNRWAFAINAIYGTSYMESGRRAWSLLSSRGLDAIVNDDLIGMVLVIASLVSGLVVAGLGALISKFGFDEPNWGMFALIGFFVGFGMTIVVMEVIDSLVAALFVCYADDPATLSATKPQDYQKLTNAMNEFYPDVHVRGQSDYV